MAINGPTNYLTNRPTVKYDLAPINRIEIGIGEKDVHKIGNGNRQKNDNRLCPNK